LVEDVYPSAEHDVQRGLALAVLPDELPACERLLTADLRQVLDLLGGEPGEERRIVGVEEVLDGCRRVIARHLSGRFRHPDG